MPSAVLPSMETVGRLLFAGCQLRRHEVGTRLGSGFDSTACSGQEDRGCHLIAHQEQGVPIHEHVLRRDAGRQRLRTGCHKFGCVPRRDVLHDHLHSTGSRRR